MLQVEPYGRAGLSPLRTPRLDFLVVGMPRSGTTLVQRLAAEIPGVVMPPETHFFPRLGEGLLGGRAAGLDRAALHRALVAYATHPDCAGLGVDVDAVMATLDPCGCTVLDVFGALCAQLAGASGPRLGEKTPDHLDWWYPLWRADPRIRFIAVVRDPRAAVSSNLATWWADAPWTAAWAGRKHLMFAVGWRRREGLIRRLEATAGRRVLTLKYEHVVADPDRSRAAIARFLEMDGSAGHREAPARMVLPWESWKREALGPVDAARAARWRHNGRLSASEAEEVTLLCAAGMLRRGYRLEPSAHWAQAAVGVARTARLLRAGTIMERDRQRRIDASDLSVRFGKAGSR